MSLLKRIVPILVLTSGLAAQQQQPAQQAASGSVVTTTATAIEPQSTQTSQETRQQFETLLRQGPPEVGTILALDPTLMSEEAFTARYPTLARFIAAHPEVRHNPRFYLSEFDAPRFRRNPVDQAFEALSIVGTFAIVAFALIWLVRTIIEQKRWNRLSRTQTEVHNKILDRFGNTEELLAYIRTPAGAKFLESAPIALHAQRAPQNPPVTRALLSIQIGVIVVAAAIGLLVVSGRIDKESSEGFFAMGMIAFCIGGGFIVSAAISLLVSRRLGLWEVPNAAGETIES